MIYYIILIISTLIATGKALICKIIGAGNTTKKEKLLFNLKAFFVAFLCSLIFIISNLSQLFTISNFSFVLSIIFAISVTFTQIAQMKAMGNGPASTVTLIYSTAFLIPIIYSFIVVHFLFLKRTYTKIYLKIWSIKSAYHAPSNARPQG